MLALRSEGPPLARVRAPVYDPEYEETAPGHSGRGHVHRSREEVERSLGEILKQYGKDERVTVETVKRWIWEAKTDGMKDMMFTQTRGERTTCSRRSWQRGTCSRTGPPPGGKSPQELAAASADTAQRMDREKNPVPLVPDIVVARCV